MGTFYRKLAIAIAAAAAIAGVFLLDPIPQDPAYHGLPNFWNVVSNLPFLVAGAFGIMGLPKLAAPELRTHYVMFCVAVMLVALGSSWYHLAPANSTLAWDRLPMTVAFMVLFSATVADRVSWFAGRALLWPLVTAGIASIAWWIRSESAGQGDLRPYALVQFLPMLLVPMILLLWREKALSTQRLWFAFGAYGAAKLAELSGYHAMKHLLAALAAWWIIRSFQRSPASAL